MVLRMQKSLFMVRFKNNYVAQVIGTVILYFYLLILNLILKYDFQLLLIYCYCIYRKEITGFFGKL